MIKLSRRAVLLSVAATRALGLGYLQLRKPKGFANLGRETLLKTYGRAYVDTPAGADFLVAADAYLKAKTKLAQPLTLYFMEGAYGLKPNPDPVAWLAAFMVHQFAMSTNVISAAETGAPLDFFAICDPHDSPCSNQLSSLNAP